MSVLSCLVSKIQSPAAPAAAERLNATQFASNILVHRLELVQLDFHASSPSTPVTPHPAFRPKA